MIQDDLSPLLNGLNDAQRQAVTAPLGAQRVLAGAGSGKTRVLVHRMAWLIQVLEQAPYSLLAVTFTNKAAQEMRLRISELLGGATQGMWIGTFHGLAHRLLRAHWQEAGLAEHFQILDNDDQLRLVKRVMRELNLEEQQWPAKQAQWFINNQKNEGRRPQHLQVNGDLFLITMQRLYHAYEAACARAGVIDFADLLLRALELWRDQPDLLAHYQRRFRHLLVDEFQDTNAVQYAWLRLLATGSDSLMVVGDDDQSIYGWRGARIENIQQFTQDFPATQTLRLEQNYRSTGTILKAANALIAHNQGRLGKALWTQGDDGEPITLYAAYNEQDEASYVVETLQQAHRRHLPYTSMAVLYRSNAQSRVLEEALLRAQVPYRIYGGLRFFERAEIKNALAYLQLILTPHHDAALERVINLPTRGIGERTLGILRQLARERNISLWSALHQALAEQHLSGRAATALTGFIELIEGLTQQVAEQSLEQLTHRLIKDSGLLAYHQKERGEKAQARVENLQELINATRAFELDTGEEEAAPSLAAFLAHTALEAGERQAGEDEDCVQLMTLHSAKGLEFSQVIMVGMEENLFPHNQTLNDLNQLEEERRLAYVGITRAMQRLLLTHTESRRLYGKETCNKISRFIRELPSELLTEVRLSNSTSQPHSSTPAAADSPLFAGACIPDTAFTLGQRVRHSVFGEGRILNFEGGGAQARVQVDFDQEGRKWLMLSYARLEPV